MNGGFLDEPELDFNGGRHIDIRFGLSIFGPLDQDADSAPTKVNLGVVGDQPSIDLFTKWVESCGEGVSAKKSKLTNLFPAFPGFGEGKPLCDFICTQQMSRSINGRDMTALSGLPDREDVVQRSVERYMEEVNDLYQNTNSDVVVCLVPDTLLKRIDMGSEPRVGPRSRKGQSDKKHKTDWHDLLKAKAMTARGPVQMIRPASYGGKVHRYLQDGTATKNIEDGATIAWNIFASLYYKGGGVPWRLARDSSELDSCFIGVSYFHDLDGSSVQTSVAQVFNERGEGVVIRGGQAKVVKADRTVHLDKESARELVAKALTLYKREHKNLPARLVCHKSSYFDDGELQGVNQAASDFGIEQVNLMSMRKSSVRFFRNKPHPPLRGTFVELDERTSLLYTQGSVDFYRSYPGLYAPRPLEVRLDQAEGGNEKLLTEVLALSKMNWNSTKFINALPVTIAAARAVGSVMRYVGKESRIQARYSFYM